VPKERKDRKKKERKKRRIERKKKKEGIERKKEDRQTDRQTDRQKKERQKERKKSVDIFQENVPRWQGKTQASVPLDILKTRICQNRHKLKVLKLFFNPEYSWAISKHSLKRQIFWLDRTPGKTVAAPMPAVFIVIMHRFFGCRNPASEQLSQTGGSERERENFTEFHFSLTSHTW
jgi:hypothetical protein